MTREEAIRKMEFCKNAYQKLIDEEVDNGTFVGTGVNGVWKADTPLTKAYSDMVDACDMAIKALEREPCEDATLEDIFCMGCEYKEQEPILDKIRAEIEQLTITEGGDDYVRKMAELFSLKMKVLQIIDKYKAESEDKE